MTGGAVAIGGSDVCVAAYEQLRREVLAGAAARGGHRALVLLLREGLAAWIERRPTSAVATAPVAAGERSTVVQPTANDQHANLVRVLVSMALSAEGR